MLRCLRRGHGLALLPRRVVADDLAAGRLAPVGWAHAPKETMVLMITHQGRWRSPLLREFMDLARESILAD